MDARILDMAVALIAGIGIGLLLASLLDEIERREASKIVAVP
jgi:hypothetical protein